MHYSSVAGCSESIELTSGRAHASIDLESLNGATRMLSTACTSHVMVLGLSNVW